MKSGITIRLGGLELKEASAIIAGLGVIINDEYKGVPWNITHDSEMQVHAAQIAKPPGVLKIMMLGDECAGRQSDFQAFMMLVKKNFQSLAATVGLRALTIEAPQYSHREELLCLL